MADGHHELNLKGCDKVPAKSDAIAQPFCALNGLEFFFGSLETVCAPEPW